MLEIRNLSKVYSPKKGVPVKALDDVSLIFPETGMVFLLGKSGSGKSTLLNLLGGLDKYDGGELIINGVSSKSFSQSQFDSYRNTCVGFIFQEYNVLDEFTVGANIALALELQGKKAEDAKINGILEKVDLAGYGGRRPGELSGGQKQRVAIARALVKSPEIIMADEPTGALDSETGKQVLDTLKKLSKEKLVIVVSHDREFAERYADRIIELSDGRVIADVERSCGAEELSKGLIYEDSTVTVPAGYHLTEQDREDINRYIESLSGEKAFINVAKRSSEFVPTDTNKLTAAPRGEFRFIRSRLPAASAFKIGAGGLKYKKFRLVITILLSCIAFGLFGLSDTLGAYDHITTCTDSIIDSEINYLSVYKKVNLYEDEGFWTVYDDISKNDIETISERCGVGVIGVWSPQNVDMSFSSQYDAEAVDALSKSEYSIYPSYFNGFCEIDETVIGEMGYRLICGTFPDGDKDEIAISEFVYETFRVGGYIGEDQKKVKITSAMDMLGKKLSFGGAEFTVTAIVDTNTKTSRYMSLMDDHSSDTGAEEILTYALSREFNCMSQYSFAGLAMTGKGRTEKMISEAPKYEQCDVGWMYFSLNENDVYIGADWMTTIDQIDTDKVVWTSGEKKALGEKEIILSEYMLDANGISKDSLADMTLELNEWLPSGNSDKYYTDTGYTVVGYIKTDENDPFYNDAIVCDSSIIERHVVSTDGVYEFVVGAMPSDRDGIENAVRGCYEKGDGKIIYSLNNSVTYELDAVNSYLKQFSKVFFWIGVGFAVFAAVMLANFIATSISYKKQEIGILRAIGSRGADVFKIFFSESLIIAGINFLLSAVGVGVVTALINYLLRESTGLLITILHFGIRQIILILLLSLAIAALASFLPVKRIASKRPIDAIRNR